MIFKNLSRKILLFCIISLSVNSYSNELKKINIQLKWLHQFQFAGYYVAKEKGYYKEHNLDVSLLEGGSNIDVHEVVAENKAEFGILGSELVLFRNKHKNFVVLAPIMQHSIRAIIGNKNKGVNSIHDLYNQKLNINLNELPEFQAMFNNEGIDINKLNYTQKDSTSNSKFINGEISAINGSIANQPFLFIKENIPIILIRPIDYGIDFYGDTLFTTRSVIKKSPNIVENIEEATKRGWDYALRNPDEAIDIIIETYNSKKSREHLYYEYEQLKKLIQPDLVEIGHNNHERWQRIVDTYKKLSLLESDYNLKGFFYEPEKEREQLLNIIVTSVIIVAAITLIVLFLIFNFNKKLKKLVNIKTRDLVLSEKKYKDLVLDLQISREDLRITLNSIGDAVIVTDNNGRITKMNPVAEKLTNWNFDDAKNQPYNVVFNIISGKTGKSVDFSIEKVLSTGKTVDFVHSIILVSRDKKKYHITETGASIKDQKGNIKGVVLVFRDITEEYNLQNKLNHRSKMDAVGQLAGGVAHDFNNMIGGIMNASKLLQSPKLNLDEKALKYVDLILKASNRAADLTSKLLLFGRKNIFDLKVIDLHKIIDETVAILNSTIDKKITIKIEKCANNHLILGDSSSIYNTLMNLSINSSQAILNGGEIIIKTTNKKLGQIYCNASPFQLEPGNYCKIEVCDTGMGINLENQKKMFEPFFTTKEQGKGTGLGLATVYGTIKRHHGAVYVYSEEGKGTCINLLLPSHEKIEISEEEQYDIIKGSGTILLVDDEEILRIIGVDMLKEMGFHVLVAENGVDAINVFKKNHTEIDLVIMDMIMPRMNGSEAFFEMKKIDRNCKVIISSGFTKNENVDELIQSGICGFISKPFIDFDLSSLIRDALNFS